MKTVLFFVSSTRHSCFGRLDGVLRYGTKHGWHVQVIERVFHTLELDNYAFVPFRLPMYWGEERARAFGAGIKAVGANTHLTLVRNAAGTITVFGPNDIVGTTSAAMTNSNAKIAKLKFTIPKQAGSPVVVMYAYLDNLKIADISAAPF